MFVFFFQIYCVGMYLENFKEYILLVKGEEDNFFEVYGFRYELRFGLFVYFYGFIRDLDVLIFRGIFEQFVSEISNLGVGRYIRI